MRRAERRLAHWLAVLLRDVAARAGGPDAAEVAGPASQRRKAELARAYLPDRDTVLLAARNGAASLLWSALSHAVGVDQLDAAVRTELRNARDREAALSLNSSAAAQRLVEGLLRTGIRVIALKGLAMRSTLYRPLNLTRAPGDIDVMVERKHLPLARDVLVQQGYVALGRYPLAHYDDHHHMEPYLRPDSPSIVVDVHWTPVYPTNPFHIVLEQWWEAAVPLEEAPPGLLRLSDLDVALHHALQLDHADAYLGKGRALFDLAAWILHRRVELPRLLERARSNGAAAVLPRVTTVIDRTFGTRMARAVGERAAPAGLQGYAWRRVVAAALWLPTSPTRVPAWYVQYCARVLGRSTNAVAALRAVLRPVMANPRLGGRGFTR